MSTFLEQQRVKNKDRRKKMVRLWVLRIQKISFVVVIWFVFMGILYGFYHLIFVKGLFKVKTVNVVGALTHVTEDSIKELAQVSVGENLFRVSLEGVKKRVLENPWVNEVAVARKLPGTIWIYVEENVPFAVVSDDTLYYTDVDGKLFKELESSDLKGFPVFTGFTRQKDLETGLKILNGYLGMEMNDFYPVQEVNYSDARGYTLIIGKDALAVRLGFEGIEEKLNRLASMIGAIEADHGRPRYVDLNIPGKVVVKYDS